jgi:hypothetical protein
VWVYDALITLGQEGTENALIEALNRFGTVSMAEDYLNCGNSSLEGAAINWASVNGYTITQTTVGVGGSNWGK